MPLSMLFGPRKDYYSPCIREKSSGKCCLPRSDREITSRCGWLTPKGEFYPCGWAMHSCFAHEHFNVDERELDKLGWIKITAGEVLSHTRRITQRQLDMLWDWSQENNTSLPWWVTEEKNLV